MRPWTFQAIVTLFSFVNCVCTISRRFAWRCPAWIARNLGRFCGVLWLVLAFLDFKRGDYLLLELDLFVVAGSIVTWNYPKDDEPPRRRKRKVKKVEEVKRPDWSGARVSA